MEYQFLISKVDRPESEDDWLPRRSKRIQHKKAQLMPAAASKFASVAGDNLLSEIFFRLSDRRSTIRCSAVCRRWRSLITSTLEIVRRRCSHGHPGPPLPYELFFTFRSPLHEARASRQSKLSEPNDYLQSLLGSYNVMASSEDLVLLTRWPTPMSLEYCVCNPLIRELVVLPQPPVDPCLRYGFNLRLSIRPNGFTRAVWYGLVCKDKGIGDGGQYSYKVILIVDCNPDIKTVIYCSEAERWSELAFSISQIAPFHYYGYFHRQFVGSNGILYATFSAPAIDTVGIVAIDAFNNDIKDPERCRFIKLPDGFGSPNGRRFQVGMVRGRLHLSKLFRPIPKFFLVKIWELNSASSWDLVDEARVWLTKRRQFISLLAFDPNSSYFIFLLCNRTVFRLRIRENKCEKFFKLSFRWKECHDFHLFFHAFTLVQHSWPTQINKPAWSGI